MLTRADVNAPRHVADQSTHRDCLIVDDEPRLRQVLVHLMRGDGFTCLEAGNGDRGARAAASSSRVTLVLSDLRMPKMDGLELLREMRARYPDVAVVMITAVADVEVAVSCLAIGAMDYLTKPFQLEEVRARVAQALEKRRLLLENRDYQERLEERVRRAGAPARGAVPRQHPVARRGARSSRIRTRAATRCA